MYNEAVDNYGCALEFIPNCYKSQKICNKAVNTSLFAIQVAPKCYKTQEICDKAVVLLYLILLLIDIRLNKCVKKLFPKNL